MINSQYFLLLKTGQAEIRGYKELHEQHKELITPIVEITRGRKNHKKTFERTGVEYNFSAIEKFIKDHCTSGGKFFVDITKAESLSSLKTKELRDHAEGYKKWVTYFSSLKHEHINAFPIMQINPPEDQDPEDYISDVCGQFDSLSEISKCIGYRAFPKIDSSFDYDLYILKERIESYVANGGIFYVILDYDYIRPGTGDLYSLEVVKVLDVIHELVSCVTPVLISTSFPSSVTDIGDMGHGEFSEEETVLHSAVSKLAHNKFNVLYGDYGSIHPIRNDDVIAANGWRPRIDYPFGGERIFYYREGRQYTGKGPEKIYTTTYSHHYAMVAQSVSKDRRFLADQNAQDENSWGVKQILEAAKRRVPGASPSFWISVRFNIHIQQQLRRLSLYP
ncbi:beta family protein [Paenochrobactrum glaciei]|uniref:Beta family protein n=1 Tax=Paenochrobactrum glaciei TaxID=486407 RepID=A0ABN1GQ94_9HYPH